MQLICKNTVLTDERKYMGELYDHADQLLDNLDDVKDIFDKYLAAREGNVTFDSIPYNVCRNWQSVLDKYFEDTRPINLPSDKQYSDFCRETLDNGGLVPYYLRCSIPFPKAFTDMLDDRKATNQDGERVLKKNLTFLQLDDYYKEQEDYYHAYF